MLGSTLKYYFSTLKYEIKTIDRKVLDLSQCSYDELKDKIIESDSDILINCAGLIKQREGVTTANFIAVNSLLPHRMSEICEQQNIKMIHVTTDCVFSGNLGNYKEDLIHDVTDVYGRSKSMGEPNNCTVIRTSIIGEEETNKLSLLEWVKSHKNKSIKGYVDHTWIGLTCLQLSKVVRQIIEENIYWKGVRHIHTKGFLSKYELVKIINEIYELGNLIEKYNSNNPTQRTLTSKHNVNQFQIPSFYRQIQETKEFHNTIRGKQII